VGCRIQSYSRSREGRWQSVHATGISPLWSTTAKVVGTEEQKEKIQKLIIENNYFVGGVSQSFRHHGRLANYV
jgi:hypothetical protein